MQHPFRLTGLLVTLCLAAFMLVASGFSCIPLSGSEDMAKMGMSSSHASEQAPAQDQSPTQQPARPCKLPWAPDGCQSMVPCAAAAVASAAVALDRAAPIEKVVIANLPQALTSVTRAPEPPPPRA
jgi:hypothetical protein